MFVHLDTKYSKHTGMCAHVTMTKIPSYVLIHITVMQEKYQLHVYSGFLSISGY